MDPVTDKITHNDQSNIVLSEQSAQKFIEEMKSIKTQNIEPTELHFDNMNTYVDASKHINDIINLHGGYMVSEKHQLERIGKEFQKYAKSNKFYKFNNSVDCKVLLNNKEMTGNIIGIDNGNLIAVQTGSGLISIPIKNNLNICGKENISQDSSAKKSIFSPSTVQSSSYTSSIESSPYIKGGSYLRSTTSKSSSHNSSSIVSSSTSTSTSRSSSHDLSTIMSSSGTTSTKVTSSKSTDLSPYLATSEYATLIGTNSTDISSVTESETEPETPSTTTETNLSSITSSSNKSEYAKLKNMKGGTTVITSSKNDKYKYLKAGKSDSVGIIESSKNKTTANSYFSESSSEAECGLCE